MTLDRIINLTTSLILGVLLSICIVTLILMEQYLQGDQIEIFSLENVSIFIGAVAVLSIIFRRYALSDN